VLNPLRIRDEETGEDQEFFIDLLIYNYILRRFVVIDLKIEDFKPEFAGKMSFYLTAVDELERQPGDEPSIGLARRPGARHRRARCPRSGERVRAARLSAELTEQEAALSAIRIGREAPAA